MAINEQVLKLDEDKQAQSEKSPSNPEPKKTRKRTPNYPFCNLAQAIGYIKTLKGKYGTYDPIAIDLLHNAWEYKKLSGQIKQIVGALNSFGLIQSEGHQNDRKIRINERAIKIIDDHPSKAELIKQAALQPKPFKQLWDKYKDGSFPKPDDILERDLRWGETLGYQIENKRARRTIIKNFNETIKFAKLEPTDIMDTSVTEQPEAESLEHEEANEKGFNTVDKIEEQNKEYSFQHYIMDKIFKQSETNKQEEHKTDKQKTFNLAIPSYIPTFLRL